MFNILGQNKNCTECYKSKLASSSSFEIKCTSQITVEAVKNLKTLNILKTGLTAIPSKIIRLFFSQKFENFLLQIKKLIFQTKRTIIYATSKYLLKPEI